ncbi:hypothetical protein AAEX28_06355 [Lentisphaerota bacterium WC36G]|nr:hypothetical protein LJT99_09220 [Lentisphaerae bacterium WC36]
MNAVIFTFILLFFSVVGDVFLSHTNFILPISAVVIFYLVVSRNAFIVFPMVCLSGIMIDKLLLYPYALGTVFALFVAIIGVIWLINGEFSYGALPHALMVMILNNFFIMICYILAIGRNIQVLSWSYSLDLLLNLIINSIMCLIAMPLLIKYGDIFANALSIEPFSQARVNYIQKRKEL